MFKKLFLSITIAFTGILLYAQDGALDLSFDPGSGANNNIYTTAIQSDGKIIIGGIFTSYNGTSISRIARLNADGTLDPTFNTGTGPYLTVHDVAIQSDGKIVIGGDFTSYNGTSINRIARLNTDGTLDLTFDPGTGADNDVRTVAVQSDGKIIIGGNFSTYNGTSINRIVRLNADGSIDNTFNVGTGTGIFPVFDIAVQSDGNIIIGGRFTQYNGTTVNRIARLNTSGSLDVTFNQGTNFDNSVYSLAIQPDGKIVVVGVFTTYNNTSRTRVARLNADGTLDLSFNPGTGADNYVLTTNLQSDGKIIIAGGFTTYNGTSINRIARLNVDGSLDNNFNPGTGADDFVRCSVIQNDDKIIIGGDFNFYNGTSRNLVARINSCNPVTQPSAISGSTDLCNGDTETYSVTNDPNADTYNWTLPSGWSGTSTTNSINVTAGSTGGTIEVTAENTCGTSTVETLTVNVNDIPAQPSSISGNTDLCNGDAETFSVTNDPNADTYNWTLSGGLSGTSTSNSINVTAGITGGTIEVTAENACGTSTVQTLTVNVDDIPAQPSSISGNTDLCNGDVETYSVTNDPNADTYNWTLPSGLSGSSTTNSISVTAGSTGGAIEVTATNACGTSTVQTIIVNVNDVPAQTSTITGNTNLCAGDVETYSVTNDPNADTYNWTLPSGWSGTSTSNSINGTSGSTGGTIEVTAENACGASSPQTIAITVDDVPAQPGTISGDDVVCEGSEQNYGITSVSGASDYTWSLPGGWSGTSATNMITTTVSTLGGNLTVTANNACGSSTPQTLSITVNELPTVTYDQDPAFACVYHDAFTLGSASPSGGTFSGTGVSGNDFDPGTADIGTHDITYTYTDGNGCSNEAMQQIEVDGCVGLEDQESQSMTVYPNPFDEAFTIEFNKSGDHTVELLNSLGQIITTVRTEEQSTQISTTDLSPGVYYIRIVEDNSSFKVVKK